jgi:hypothetical protein
MVDIGGSFLENQYAKFVKDGGTTTQCQVFGLRPWSAINNVEA